ncbi:hypothetical protein AWC02_03750 [Mycolicibacter engbaekii]|uniref:Uncharacterized protein n=1 Tax=Mycolicibacter engbaekii TaxID=188915 RepID=A0A1X1U1M7_9MYCO|nr:hypothetical protein AWC02_03750 [Mycolicibacter engbaekii]
MQVLVLGSQYWPPGQPSGVGPWPRGMQVLVLGSQYWPAGQFSGSAEPTAGMASAPSARGAAARATAVARPHAKFLIGQPSLDCPRSPTA